MKFLTMFFRSIETAVLGVLPVVPLLCSPTASSTAKEIDTHLISPKKKKKDNSDAAKKKKKTTN